MDWVSAAPSTMHLAAQGRGAETLQVHGLPGSETPLYETLQVQRPEKVGLKVTVYVPSSLSVIYVCGGWVLPVSRQPCTHGRQRGDLFGSGGSTPLHGGVIPVL